MPRYRSIRFKLLFSFVAVILLPILTLGIFGPLVAARAMESEAIGHTARLIGQVTNNIEFYIREMEAVISILAEDPDVQAFYASEPGPLALAPDREQGARRLLRTLSTVNPEIAGIILVNERDGYLSNEIQPITRDPLGEERWYLSAVQNLGEIELLPRPIGRNLRNVQEYSADDVVSIVKAVIDPLTARCRGVVLIDMKLAVVEGILVDMTLGRGGFLFIEDRGGGIVYAPVNPVVYRVRSEWLEWPRTSAVRTIKGADYQILSLGSEYTGWRTIGVFPLNEIMRQVGTIRYYSIIIAGVTVFLAFLASVFFTSSIARPVIALRALMKKAEAGDLGVRFEGRQDDEIGHLGRSFNTMIEEVQKLIDLVYQEQQSKREAELRTLQEQIKPHFLYNTLDTIQWMAQSHGAEDIVEIVGALTRLFRIGLSKGKEMIAVRDELDHVRSYLIIQKARYEDKFDFTISVDDEVLPFMMLKLTLQPLVENAIYHGIKERRGPGSIEVAAARRDGMLVFRVADNGVGMSEELLAAVRASLQPSAVGLERSGYGLSNVHERIQLSFGPDYGLSFESSPGAGTAVELLHPLVMPEGRVAVWKVLIADDEPKIRRGLKASIERARTDMTVVAEAEDGAMALELAERERPDILLIDIRMPIMNGLELIERIAAVRRDCLIIVVTGHDEFEYAKKALQLKVFEYLLKPVSRDALAAVLARADAELAGTRRQDLYLAWAREQLAKNMPLLREQFLRDWVADRLSRSEIDEQVEFLGLRIADDPSMAVIHLVERFLDPETSGERSRRLALYAVRSVVEELLAGLVPLVVFQDEHDNIVAISSSPGSAWGQAIAAIESRVSQSLAHGVIVASKHVAGGLVGVPEAYETLAAEIARKASFGSFVVLAQGYIDAHYADPDLSLEEVSAEAQISPGYLSRLLKQETGFSFVDYLTRVRITQALQILNNPSMKIYEVAEAVGYQSQHYFSRAFKRVFGRSPAEYRKGGHP